MKILRKLKLDFFARNKNKDLQKKMKYCKKQRSFANKITADQSTIIEQRHTGGSFPFIQ